MLRHLGLPTKMVKTDTVLLCKQLNMCCEIVDFYWPFIYAKVNILFLHLLSSCQESCDLHHHVNCCVLLYFSVAKRALRAHSIYSSVDESSDALKSAL